jgi:SsrA-binding protein
MTSSPHRDIAINNKARFEYFIDETFEAGIMLVGSEVKSMRDSKVSLNEAFVDSGGNELFLMNCHIAEYKGANRFNHDPKRPRKLLLHKQQIKKLIGKIKIKGSTIVPLRIYLNDHNKIKVEIALVHGKKLHDKRNAIKERDWQREKSREFKSKDRD